jgi:hypothetical protein
LVELRKKFQELIEAYLYSSLQGSFSLSCWGKGWGAPVLFIPEEAVALCIDYRALNKVT